MADAGQYEKVKNIINGDTSRQVVVVSAAGKRFSDDHKITDLLYLCHAHIKYGVDCSKVFDEIRERYISIKKDCGLKVDIEGELDKIYEKLVNGITEDELVSRGEYLSAILMADFLGFRFVDSADWVTFFYDGSIDYESTYEKLRKITAKGGIVIPGFYGVLPNGDIKVMSRGGSDITGALAAAALEADVYENWTDVPGVLMADPRIVKNPKPIKEITYDELRELSYMGAQVLHEATVYPVKQCNIPLNIRDTNHPEVDGTMILEDIDQDIKGSITGIAGKKDFSIISITKTGLSTAVGALRDILDVFANYKIPIEFVPSGIDTVSVVVSTKKIQKKQYNIINEIQKTYKPENIEITDSLALVAVVGRNMVYKPGTSGMIFAALGKHGINVRMISQGPDERNIVVGVDNGDYEKAIKVLYEEFAE